MSLIGHYGCVFGTSPVSRAIQVAEWTTGSCALFNHCFVVVSETEIVEALWPEIRVSPLSKYHERALYDQMVLPSPTREGIARSAIAAVGQPYSLIGLAAFGLYDASGCRWTWPATLSTRVRGQFCSELVANNFADNGVVLIPGRAPSVTSPSNLADLILHDMEAIA